MCPHNDKSSRPVSTACVTGEVACFRPTCSRGVAETICWLALTTCTSSCPTGSLVQTPQSSHSSSSESELSLESLSSGRQALALSCSALAKAPAKPSNLSAGGDALG